jgi:hypothetical protein
VPTKGATTSTVTRQVAPAAMLLVLKLMLAAPAVGVKLVLPQPEEIVTFGTGATTIAAGDVGKLSLKTRLVKASALGLLTSKRKVVGTPTATGLVKKVLLKTGGANTSTLATAGVPVVAGVVDVTLPVVLA